jgi:hypothetical protein
MKASAELLRTNPNKKLTQEIAPWLDEYMQWADIGLEIAKAVEAAGSYAESLTPTLKIGPVAAGRRRMNQALHSRVLKDSMVTLYSSASGFLIARRATASWFNLSKWSATLKAAPSQLAAAG